MMEKEIYRAALHDLLDQLIEQPNLNVGVYSRAWIDENFIFHREDYRIRLETEHTIFGPN